MSVKGGSDDSLRNSLGNLDCSSVPTEIQVDCLLCWKSTKADKIMSMLTPIPKKKILNAFWIVFKIPGAPPDALQHNLPSHFLCCPSCCCTLFDALRIRREIERLNESLECLENELKNKFNRGHKRYSSKHDMKELQHVRQALLNHINGLGNHSQAEFARETDDKSDGRTLPIGLDADTAVTAATFVNDSFFTTNGEVTTEENHDSDTTNIFHSGKDSNLSVTANKASSEVKSPSHSPRKGPILRYSRRLCNHKIRSTAVKSPRKTYPRKRVKCKGQILWFNCSYCKKAYVKSNFKTEEGDHVFKCDVEECGREFYNFSVFQKHHQLTCPMKPSVEALRCEECGKQCSSFQTLERHNVSFHTKKFEYYCEKCGLGLVSKGALNRHMLCHTNEKKFECNICDKSFKRKMQLKYHVMRHKNELPYMCDNCGKRFLDPQKLKRHSASHSTDRQYPCPLCDKLFATKNYVYNHIYCTHKKLRQSRRKPV